ncbi:MAG TPA: 30S ribosomal protein S5 [Candidatus Nanoarchaeia archaeon]|nr:30S ribosomal protein S5 [Candidatus Nanoarchaeia archaeon]
MKPENKPNIQEWKPKTLLGKKVKNGEIGNIDELLDKGIKVLEPEIIDVLLPNLQVELLEVGQSKGKFGGGKASIWKQTQKKTKEGNIIKFSTYAVVGNRDGYIGIGNGFAKETVPAREKAIRNAKLNIIKIRRGCGAWACDCGQAHSIPFTVHGKSGSCEIELIPAPKGTRLCVEKKLQLIFNLAGIKDVYSKSKGITATKFNFVKAGFDALKKLSLVKVPEDYKIKAGIVEGRTDK